MCGGSRAMKTRRWTAWPGSSWTKEVIPGTCCNERGFRRVLEGEQYLRRSARILVSCGPHRRDNDLRRRARVALDAGADREARSQQGFHPNGLGDRGRHQHHADDRENHRYHRGTLRHADRRRRRRRTHRGDLRRSRRPCEARPGTRTPQRIGTGAAGRQSRGGSRAGARRGRTRGSGISPRASRGRFRRFVGRRDAAAQVRRGHGRRESQSRRGAAGGIAGAPGTRLGTRARGRHHPHPQCRSGADGDAGRRGTVSTVRRGRSRASRTGGGAGSAPAQGRSGRQCVVDRHHPRLSRPRAPVGRGHRSANAARDGPRESDPGSESAAGRIRARRSDGEQCRTCGSAANGRADRREGQLCADRERAAQDRAPRGARVRNGAKRRDHRRGDHRQGRSRRHRGRILAGGRTGQPGLEGVEPVMRNISAWAIRHPIIPIVLFVVLFFLGVVAFIRLPINLQPDISFPAVNVYVSQPGAAPTEMETQIAQKVEGSISNIGNVRNMTTFIVEGQVNIFVLFEIGTPVDRAVTDVRDAVARVRSDLPQGIYEPQVARVNVDGGAFAYYAVSTTDLTPEQLSWFIDNTITKRLLALPGVAQVSRSGGVDREIRVELDPARLQALGLTAVEVNEQLRALNMDAAGGRAQVGGGEQAIRVLGGAKTAEALGDTQIILPGGKSVRLGEIADVNDGVAEVRTIARLNGRAATTFGVFKAKGASDVTVAKAVDAELEKLKSETPAVQIERIFTTVDHTVQTYHS